TITYISPLNGSVYVNELPIFNATIDSLNVNEIGMSFNGVDGYADLTSIDITQFNQGLNSWKATFLINGNTPEEDFLEGEPQYFYYYSREKASLFDNIKNYVLNFINNIFFKRGENLNVETMNITNISYIKLNEVAGNCDLTVNHSICSNATGTYIVG